MKKTQNKPAAEESTSVRLDKWLWAARFFKTRTLSQDNIELGRIRMNGVRLKASKEIKIGDQLEIIRGEERFIVVVKALSSKRGSAAVAQTLYEETPDSLETRTRIQRKQPTHADAGKRLSRTSYQTRRPQNSAVHGRIRSFKRLLKTTSVARKNQASDA